MSDHERPEGDVCIEEGGQCHTDSESISSTDSLFGEGEGGGEGDDNEASETKSSTSEPPLARNQIYTLPPHGHSPVIPGLYFLPNTLSTHDESSILASISSHGYLTTRNQSMLFGRARSASSGLPPWADSLVALLAQRLRGDVEDAVWRLLFRSCEDCSTAKKRKLDEEETSRPTSRQLILNHYTPPEGITLHIDLPTRFGDGILILSLSSGIGMDFTRDGQQDVRIYLPPLSCVVLTGDARWEWKHGIRRDVGDWVVLDNEEDDWVLTQYTKSERVADDTMVYYVPRTQRTSVTIRWLLPGADVVGQ